MPSAIDLALIDLSTGHPTRSILPVTEVREAMSRLSFNRVTDALEYGSGKGPDSTRQEFARLLSRRYRHPVSADELLLGHGTSLNLALTCQVLTQAGDVVVCEDPTYYQASHIFATVGLDVRGIPVDGRGMRVDILERQLLGGLRPRLVYCIPSFNNPTGVDLAPERAERLVELAQEYDLIIVADEPYTLLHFDAAPPRCMMSYDRGRARVFGLGTFSKLLAPGLRAGWVHAHPDLVERFVQHGAIRSGGNLNPVAFALIEELLDNGGLDAIIDGLRDVYRERARIMVDSIRTHLDCQPFHRPHGGYFVWLESGRLRDCDQLLETSTSHGVTFTPGTCCAVERDLGHCVRLCFSRASGGQIRLGIERLASAIGVGA